MNKVLSKDGTTIAYDKQGTGPAVILVAGALCSRLSWSGPELSTLLSSHFTVYNYDRRGRGESGDIQPYTVQKEIDDIEALIDEAGGSAYLWGHSSGGSLALEATVKLREKVKKLAFYEAPYNDNPQDKPGWRAYINQLKKDLAANRRSDAVALFMKYVGTPVEQIEGMKQSPMWTGMEAIAPTLAYDHIEILRNDRAIPIHQASLLSVPTLAMTGDTTDPFIQDATKILSNVIPHAQLCIVEGQSHAVDIKVIAPMLVKFFNGSDCPMPIPNNGILFFDRTGKDRPNAFATKA